HAGECRAFQFAVSGPAPRYGVVRWTGWWRADAQPAGGRTGRRPVERRRRGGDERDRHGWNGVELSDGLPGRLSPTGDLEPQFRGRPAAAESSDRPGRRRWTGQHLQRRGAITRFGDRKSTRLNSSHVAIAYAVSWLKKKEGRPSLCRRRRTAAGAG